MPTIFEQLLGTSASQMFGAAATRVEPVIRELTEWVTVLQRHAVQKWAPVILSGAACSVRKDRAPCGHAAVAKCALCKQLVCLGHAAVGYDATAICEVCLDIYREHVEVEARRRAEAPPRQPPPAGGADAEAAAAAAALRTLGLPPDATWDDVKAAFKRAAREHHPDRVRARSPRERARSEARMKAATEAYHVLEKRMQPST